MTGQERSRERLNLLLSDLLDGALADQQIAELRVLLRDDEAARELYFNQVMTHAMLQWRHGSSAPAGVEGALQQSSSRLVADRDGDNLKSDQTVRSLPADQAGERQSNSPSTFGFLGGLGTAGAFYPVTFVLLLMVLAGGVQGVRMFVARDSAVDDNVSNHSQNTVASGDTQSAMPASLRNVAKITGSADCIWCNAKPNLKIGDGLAVGQTLELASGVTEITFDVGARVILQSPASFSIDSSKSIRLANGKLTAEITNKSAHGFTVVTPDATFVDQGTEFGVEVAPGGGSRVHVFKGEVDLALSNKAGAALPTQRLLANSGARLEGDAPNVTFVEETGESYLRSMDETERDLHVMAYWRFEDHPVGTLLPDTHGNTTVTCATVDSSFNGNDLFTYIEVTRPVFSNDVATGVIPETNRANRSCLDNTQFPHAASTRDLYTNSSFSHASPVDIQRTTPARWTVEASIKMVELGRMQTFVGRDGAEAHVNTPPRFAFQITTDGHVALRFVDVDNRSHEVVSDDFTITPGRWYHAAGVSDGRQLRLFANALDGRGYQLVGHADLPEDGSTALGCGGPEAEWTIGRGKAHNGLPGEWFKGWIDEVRICDIALDPSAFLFAPRVAGSAIGSSATNDFLATREETKTTD